MAYNEQLATRVRVVLKGLRSLAEKKMFGGLAYLSHGKMFAGILRDDLVVRVGPHGHEAALKQPHTRPMDFTGKPMKGYVYVNPNGTKTAAQLRAWLRKGLDFDTALPATKRKPVRSTATPIHRHRRRT